MSFDNSKVIATKGFLIGAADAIRRKLGTSDTITLPNFESAIDSIPSGGGEPYIPREQIMCNFDFTSNTPYYDSVRQSSVQTHSGVIASSDGIELTTINAYIPIYKGLSKGESYKIELEFGNYNIDTSSVADASAILNFSTVNPQNENGSICWRKNVSAWACYTSIGWMNFPSSYGIDAFKNKKIIVLYNCRYIDGEIVKVSESDLGDYHIINIYDENMNYIIGAIRPNNNAYVQAIGIGASNGYSCKGMVVKSLKVYNLNLYTNPSQSIIQPITITENGTYTANGNTVAGYSPITVNIHEVLESEFDLLHSGSTQGFLDIVKNVSLPTDAYSGFNNGYITDRNVNVPMNKPNYGDIKRVVVKTGEFDRSAEPSEEWLNLMRLNTNDWHFNLTYNTSGDYWRVSDATGATIDIPASTLPKYAFEDTTFEIIFGAKYINGELYRGIKTNGVVTENYTNRLYVYLNDNLVMENQYQEIYPTIRVGGGNGWTGALFENVKIYNVLDCYDKYYETPVSLMSASPSEIKSSSETESIDEKSIDESIKEDEKSIEEEKADDIKEILDDENNFETKK